MADHAGFVNLQISAEADQITSQNVPAQSAPMRIGAAVIAEKGGDNPIPAREIPGYRMP
jgi:hypothetical protein